MCGRVSALMLVLVLGCVSGEVEEMVDNVLGLVSSRTGGCKGQPGLETHFSSEDATYELELSGGELLAGSVRLARRGQVTRRHSSFRTSAVLGATFSWNYQLLEVESAMASIGRLEADWESELQVRIRTKGCTFQLKTEEPKGGFSSLQVFQQNPFFLTPIHKEHLAQLSSDLSPTIALEVSKASSNISICDVVHCSGLLMQTSISNYLKSLEQIISLEHIQNCRPDRN